MPARFALRLLAAVQAFLLLSALVLPGAISANTPPALLATLTGNTVTVTGTDFGADELVDVTTNDPAGSQVDSGPAQADASGAFTYSFQLSNPSSGTYSVSGAGQTSGGSASTTFDGLPAPTPDPTEPPPSPTDSPPTPTEPAPDPTAPAPDPTQTPPSPTATPEAATDPYIVTFASGTSAAEQSNILAGVGATENGAIPVLRMAAILLPPSTAQASVNALRADPSVVAVEHDRVRSTDADPSDPTLVPPGHDMPDGAMDDDK